MGGPTHRHDTRHRGLVPVSQLASGTPAPGDAPVYVSGDTATWEPITPGTIGAMVDPMTAPGDLIVGGTGPGADLALAGTATAISNASGKPPSNAIDGNDSTYWQCSTGNSGDWLKVDLGSALAVVGFRLHASSDGGGFAWELQSSPDGTTWTTRFTRSTGYDVSGSIPSIAARYWRMHTTATFGEAFVVYTFSLFAPIYAGPARLPYSTDGKVLTGVAGMPAWADPTGGFTNPLTTQDDIIVQGASAAGRLGKGTDGQVLTVDPTTHHLLWATPPALPVNVFIGTMDPKFKPGNCWLASNAVYAASFSVQRPTTVGTAHFFPAYANGNLDIGIYDDALNLVASTGSFACPSPGSASQALTAPVLLVPGVLYWAAIASDAWPVAVIGVDQEDFVLGDAISVPPYIPLPSSILGAGLSTKVPQLLFTA